MISLQWGDKEYVPSGAKWRWHIKDPRVWWCYSYVNQREISILKVIALEDDPMAKNAGSILIKPGHADPELFKHDIMLALLSHDILVVEPTIAYDSAVHLPNLDLGSP